MTTYWISDICVLITSLDINPFNKGDKNKQFNALTRLIIAVTLISAIFQKDDYENIILAGGISILLSVLIYLSSYNTYSENFLYSENYVNDEKINTTVSDNSKKMYNENIHDLTLEKGIKSL